jgi:GPH family glycoside/pentoside/hexuronide:cation symporter
MTAVPAETALPAPSARLPLRIHAGYGAGQVAGQIFRDAPSLLLLFFMTNALGVEPALAGAAIFFPKLFWGVLSDLTVGLVSDRWKARFPRKLWLLIGAVLAPVALILLFHVPQGSSLASAFYVAGAFSLYMIVFACFSVPYLAIGTELSDDPKERTVVMAWRMGFSAVGLLVGNAVAPVLVQTLGGGRPAYSTMSLVLAAVCAVSLLIAFLTVPRAKIETAATPKLSLKAVASAVVDPTFRPLIGAYLLQLIGSGLGYAAMVYFLSYNMHRADALTQIGLIVLAMSAVVIAAQPLWITLSAKFGKKKLYVASALGHGVVQIAWGFSAGAPLAWIYGLVVAFALFNSGWTLMGYTLLSDVIATDDKARGESRAGVFSALWTGADKIGFALGGTLLTGLVLSAFGFSSALAVTGAAQPASALTGVAIAFAFAPAAFNLAASALYAKFGK